PAVCLFIVQNIRVTIVRVHARGAYQCGEKRIVRGWAGQSIAVLIKNLERFVDRFDVMVWADIALAVTRLTTACIAYPLEGQQRSRHLWRRPGKAFHQFVQQWRGRSCGRWRSGPKVRIARQPSLLKFLLGRDVREVFQIRSHHNRADHLDHVRSLCARRVLTRSGAIVLLGLFCAVSLSEQRYSNAEEAKGRGKQNAEIKKGDCE